MFGTPIVLETLKALLEELIVEEVILTDEMRPLSPDLYEEIKKLMPKQQYKLISFERFRMEVERAKYTIRTGENENAYANILITAASGMEEYYREFV